MNVMTHSATTLSKMTALGAPKITSGSPAWSPVQTAAAKLRPKPAL